MGCRALLGFVDLAPTKERETGKFGKPKNHKFYQHSIGLPPEVIDFHAYRELDQ